MNHTDHDPFSGKEHAIFLMGKSEALYMKHLHKFFERHRNDAAALAELIRGGDPEEARIEAHSLKGLSATLGLLYISKAAEALEHALERGADTTVPMKTLAERLGDAVRAYDNGDY